MTKIIIALNIILLGGIFVIAQDKKVSPDFDDQAGPQTRQRAVPGKQTKNQSMTDSTEDVLLESGTNLDAKLLSTLDVKNAQVGDEVLLKTTKSIKQNGDVIVPKGTKLIGRISEVQKKSKENRTSKISMVFERLQNKNLTLPINASIISIANASGNLRATDLFETGGTGSSRSTTRSSGSRGLLGGVGNTVGSVTGTATNTLGGVTSTAANTVGGASATIGRTLNGIQIMSGLNATTSGSSTLSAENKNIRLQKGTNFQLQLNESIRK
jgi:hypothetical protein